MVQRLTVNDRTLWLKEYGAGSRRIRLTMLDWLARALGIPALRPPPHLSGTHAKQLELSRLSELQRAHVAVPEVVGEGHAMLLLADMGASLSSRLRQARGDETVRDQLVASVVQAISDAHAKGQYLGQPTPRNIVAGMNGICFIDFEEDPGEVMSLVDAQTRDWLMFVHGVAKHYPAQSPVLAELVSRGIAIADPKVAENLTAASSRLVKLAPFLIPFGGKSGKLQVAINSLSLIRIGLLVTAVLLIDYLPDKDIDLFALNVIGIFA